MGNLFETRKQKCVRFTQGRKDRISPGNEGHEKKFTTLPFWKGDVVAQQKLIKDLADLREITD